MFQRPGANANPCKELVLAGMLIAARNVAPRAALRHRPRHEVARMEKTVEDGKKHFAGIELAGRTLGIVGLARSLLWPTPPSSSA